MEISFETYPKIRRFNKLPEMLKEEEVVITEKIHGSNMRIFIPKNAKSEKDLLVGGRKYNEGQQGFGLQSYAKMIRSIIDFKLLFKYFKKFKEDVIIFGELYGLGVQKGITYCEDKRYIIFDIMIGEKFLDYNKTKKICKEAKLEMVPLVYKGKPSKKIFDKFINVQSTLAKKNKVKLKDNLTEGIVIRSNPLKLDEMKDYLICKYKSNRFKEQKIKKRSKRHNLSKINEFVDRFVTKIRVEKMIDILKEKSKYKGIMADVPALGLEVANDIIKEEKDEFDKLLSKDSLFTKRQVVAKIITKTALIYKEILGV